MSIEKTTPERRREKRILLRDGCAYTVIRPPANKIGGVIDISLSGLAFSYFSIDGKVQKPERLDILCNGDLVLENIQCETVNEFAIPNEQPFSQITMRRCCIKFGSLTPQHIEQIKDMMTNHGIADN